MYASRKRFDRLIVGALAALHDETAAIIAAQRLIAARGYRYADVLFEPNLAAARQSPAYGVLVNKLGLVAYWRSKGHAPDVCGTAGPPAFCAAA